MRNYERSFLLKKYDKTFFDFPPQEDRHCLLVKIITGIPSAQSEKFQTRITTLYPRSIHRNSNKPVEPSIRIDSEQTASNHRQWRLAIIQITRDYRQAVKTSQGTRSSRAKEIGRETNEEKIRKRWDRGSAVFAGGIGCRASVERYLP